MNIPTTTTSPRLPLLPTSSSSWLCEKSRSVCGCDCICAEEFTKEPLRREEPLGRGFEADWDLEPVFELVLVVEGRGGLKGLRPAVVVRSGGMVLVYVVNCLSES